MTTVTTLGVTGMTCGNCVKHVTEELTEVPGVENVTVALEVGGTSEVVVTSDAALDEAALRAAVDEAGYEVATLTVQAEGDVFAEMAAKRAAHRDQAPHHGHPHEEHAGHGGHSGHGAGGCGCGGHGPGAGGCGCGGHGADAAGAVPQKTYSLEVPPRA